MMTARIIVLMIALCAGGVAAYLASGSDNKPPASIAEPVANIRTVDVVHLLAVGAWLGATLVALVVLLVFRHRGPD